MAPGMATSAIVAFPTARNLVFVFGVKSGAAAEIGRDDSTSVDPSNATICSGTVLVPKMKPLPSTSGNMSASVRTTWPAAGMVSCAVEVVEPSFAMNVSDSPASAVLRFRKLSPSNEARETDWN